MAESHSDLPIYYCMVLFPGFQALDAFGPMEILNNLSHNTTIQLSIIAATLAPVSTSVAKIPLLQQQSPQQGQVINNSNCEQFIVPTHTFDLPPDRIDVLLVPGGVGNRFQAIYEPVTSFLAQIFPKIQYLITVCTGSALAARAGVLDGRRATSNKTTWEYVIGLSDKVEWVRKARWVADGNVWTSSGVSAGIDCTLAFVEKVYGREMADTVTNMMEYVRNEAWDNDPFC